MKRVVLFLLLLPVISKGQSIAARFNQNKCTYETDGKGKSLGLNIKLAYPCEWKAQDGDRPHVVKKFSTTLPDTATSIITLVIVKMDRAPTAKEFKYNISNKGLRELTYEPGDSIISAKPTIIDGLDCGEIIHIREMERASTKISMYNISYHFYYKDKYILLTFSLGGQSKERYKKYIPDFTLLFRNLASKFILLNQWK